MPYRTAAQRVRKYELAVIPDNVRAKFAALLPLMIDGQEVAQAKIEEMEVKVRDLLNSEGIIGVARVPYLNLARSVFRASGSQSGLALRKYATAEKAKAVSLGLDPSICDKIINIVIGTTAY